MPAAPPPGSQALPAQASPARLTVQPLGRTVPVGADQSLLQAALAAGLRLPSSCRNGTCRACICQLLAGEVRYRTAWPGLSREEISEGWVLPCVALCSGAVTVHAPEAIDLFRP